MEYVASRPRRNNVVTVSRRPPSSIPALLRSMGWLTSVAAIVVLSYVLHKWPVEANSVSTGILGVAVSMLNDSWQMVAVADRFPDIPPIPPHRLIIHDMFSFMICLGGVLLIVLKSSDKTIYGPGYDTKLSDDGDTPDEFSREAMTSKAVWFLVVVCIWRVLFTIIACFQLWKLIRRRRQREARVQALNLQEPAA